MILKILHFFSLTVLFLFSRVAIAQELDLDSFVQSILKYNPGVQKILAENAIAAGTLEASLGIDDAILSSSLNLSHSEPNGVIGSEPTESDDTRLNLSYDRLFSGSGTRLSVSYGNQYTDRNPALVSYGNRYYQPSFSVRLTQPLLKNVGGIQDRLNIKLNQLNHKLALLSSQENLESYITQLANLYNDWYLASRELAISKEVYQQSIEQEKLTRTKVKRQVSESYELLRVQETREDYFSRWQQAKGRFEGLSHKVQYQMNLNNQVSIDKLIPRNPKDSQLLAAITEDGKAKDYLSKNSRLKNILDNLQEQQLILLNAKDNSRKSDLNLSLGYTKHGIDSGFSDAHSNMDKNDYTLMLEYKYPLGNRRAKGNYQVQRVRKRQVEADVKQRLIDAESNLKNLQIQASQLIIALQSTNRKIQFATKKLKKEQRLYRIGKLDLFELLRDQTTQLESRLNRERLYTQLYTLRLSIGELLDQNIKPYVKAIKPSAITE